MKTGAAHGLRPPPNMNIVEWADEYRMIPKTSSEPGKWRTSRTPYLREIMEAMSPGSGVEKVTVMKPAQIGGTEVILNAIGHMMMIDPGSALVVLPTDDTSRGWSSERLTPMISAVPELARMFGRKRRNENNKTVFKRFPGGQLAVAYSTSSSQLASRPVRYVFLDEVDKYPRSIDDEGDPVELAIVRTRTFGPRRKILLISTPSIKGRSRIEAEYLAGDQRKYYIPCPCCDEMIHLEFENLEKTDGDSVVYRCQECGDVFDESEKTTFLELGEWIVHNPDAPEHVRSYSLSGLCAPLGWLPWTELVEKHEKAANDREELQVFTNGSLGRPFEDTETESVDWNVIYSRRSDYEPGTVPMGGLFLTAGVDVQKDRLEIEVVAWGRGMRSWSVDFQKIHGSPTQQSTWDQLTNYLNTEFPTAYDLPLSVERLCIDTGYLSNDVYVWAGQNRGFVFPIKGGTSIHAPTIGTSTKMEKMSDGRPLPISITLWTINGHKLKDTLFAWLALPYPKPDEEGVIAFPDGWCEFPSYGPEYFEGLLAEQKVIRKGKDGHVSWRYEKIYDRNEPLDCRVYATAAVEICGVRRWTPTQWDEREKALKRKPEVVKPTRREGAMSFDTDIL